VTRIISGSAGGRRLAVPPGRSTRPTSDRAREGLFATLESLRGPLAGARVLDLYAGSGAVGLEALSRGAAHALLVDSDRRAAATIRANAHALGLAAAEVQVAAVERLVTGAPSGDAYDVAFLDPPYDVPDEAVRSVLRALAATGWLAAGCVVVVERPSRAGDYSWPAGFRPERARRYGEGTLWYGHA
jgi:16S rRNA (guanine966-N2)-methyltransferase